MKKICAVILNKEKNEKNTGIIRSRLLAQTIKPYNIFEMDNMDEAMQVCSDCEYVLVISAQVIPKNKYLIERLLESVEKDANTNAVAFPRQEPRSEADLIDRFAINYMYGDEPVSGIEMAAETNNNIRALYGTALCALYNRKLYEEIGGFPLNPIANGDMVYAAKALKAEKDIIYNPKAAVINCENHTGAEIFKIAFDSGVARKKYSYIYKDYHDSDVTVTFVTEAIKYVYRRHQYIMIIPLLYRMLCKLTGYNLGKIYRHLPEKMVMKCTYNQEYWKREASKYVEL